MHAAATEEIRTERLVLTPLRVEDASEMAGVLADPELYTFTGGDPPSADELFARYAAQVAGPDGEAEVWHNWILRSRVSGAALGFVQATVVDGAADVAWVVGVDWQGQGFAREGAAAICAWLAGTGVRSFDAHIHPSHIASQRVAMAVGLRSTGEIDGDGELIWRWGPHPI